MLQFPGRIALCMDIRRLLQLQGAFASDRVVNAAAKEQQRLRVPVAVSQFTRSLLPTRQLPGDCLRQRG